MGMDIEVSITIRRGSEYENLPRLEDDFSDMGGFEEGKAPKYRRRYFRNSAAFQWMREKLIHDGKHPHGDYRFHVDSDKGGNIITNQDGTPKAVEWVDDFGHGWFTLAELKKVIKSKKLRREFIGSDPYYADVNTEDYDGIIQCLKLLRDDVRRNVIGHTFDRCYCPDDSDVIICVAFNN